MLSEYTSTCTVWGNYRVARTKHGCKVSSRNASGIHPKCWPQARGRNDDLVAISSCPSDLIDLPSLEDIFTTPIFTKDHLVAEFWPLVRTEYLKLLREDVIANRRDAWDPLPKPGGGFAIGMDCLLKQRSRRAWLERLMFPKAVNKRGQRWGQALAFTKALLIRWSLGERRGLWDEAVMVSRSRSKKWGGRGTWDSVESEVRRLVAWAVLGKPLSAWSRLDLRKTLNMFERSCLLNFHRIPLEPYYAPR